MDEPDRARVRDRGAATTLTTVLVTPVVVVLGVAAVQAAMWSHARTEVRVVARDTAALVARSGVPAGAAASSARAVLAAGSDLEAVDVSVVVTPTLVTVTITGDAPGILRGTRAAISVAVAVPREGWVP